MADKNKKEYIFAVGRRREAVARVRLYTTKTPVVWKDKEVKKGEIFVNEIPIAKYFFGEKSRVVYEEPFKITNTQGKFIITAKLSGGGKEGQLEALVMGISRALTALDKDKFRVVLKKKGLLTSDARVRERRKVGTGGKARRKKQSPKR